MRGSTKTVLLLVGVLTAGQAASGEPRTTVWDTGKRFSDGTIDLDKRDGWQAVAPDSSAGHAFKGDAVVENDKLQVLFAPGCGGGPVVYSRSDVSKERRRMSLVPLGAKHEPCETITSIKIARNTGDEVAIEVTSKGKNGESARTSFSLGPARSFVAVGPVEGAAALRVVAPARFAVVPDFFGDDIVFDPRNSSGARVFVPAENCLLSLTGDGSTILMGVWPAGEQEVLAVIGGRKEERSLEAIEISFDRKNIYLAVLDGPRIWHSQALERQSDAGKDVATGWKRPFQARWRGDFRLADRTDSWEFESQRRDNVGVAPFGNIVWPFWFDGDQAMIRLVRKDYLGVALIYPLERKSGTPLAVFTPVDILRETLGTGPCEYILDREGLGARSPGGNRNLVSTGVCNTTGVMQHFFELGLECRERKLVEDLAEDVLAFNVTVRERLEEYRAFARQLTQLCREATKSNPAVKPVADRTEQLEKRLEQLFNQHLPAMKTPEQGAELIRKVKELTQKEDPENLGKYLVLAAQLRGLAGTQDSLAGVFRSEVRLFRRDVGGVVTDDGDLAKFAEKVRELARNALRKKHYTEGT